MRAVRGALGAVLGFLLWPLPVLAGSPAPVARLYLTYAYEWSGYRCSENVPGDTTRVVNSDQALTTDASLQRLDLGLANVTGAILREVRMTLDVPHEVKVSRHPAAQWQPDLDVKGRWIAKVGDLGADGFRLVSRGGPLLLEIPLAPSHVRYTVSTTNRGATVGQFTVQRTPRRGAHPAC